ncbi:MFS transporter [Actinokineospora globicatena]|uniref:Membrane protein n=1 Tax=Actinokineospora globicatena TaxID=103729 RepID=A0A9W6QJA4_9PSEU|nr:MFS transporter [Actinokineospora globicatena]GLW89617.1 membrane protein [Actinokineospora globicatena]
MGVAVAMRAWFGAVVPREPAAIRFTLLSLVQSAGNGVFLTSSPFFFTSVVGIPPTRVGVGLTIAGLCGLLACVPMGIAGDRFGTRRVLVVAFTALAVLFALYGLVTSFLWFVVVACAVAVFESSCGSLAAALVYSHYQDNARAIEVRAQVRSAINVGFPIGAAAAGVAIGVGTRTAFTVVVIATAAVHVVCALLAIGLGRAETPTTRRGPAAVSQAALKDVRFVAVAVVNGLIQMNEVILTLGVPLWLVASTSAAPSVTAVVLIANSVLVVALQVLFSRRVTTADTAARALRRAGVLVAVACLIYSTSQGPAAWVVVLILLAGVTVQTIGEIYQASGAFTVAFELAVPDRIAEYQGVMALGVALRQFLGPVVVGSLVIGLGRPGWWVLGALFAGLGFVAVPLVRALARHRAVPEPRVG